MVVQSLFTGFKLLTVGQNVCEFAFETNSETAKLWHVASFPRLFSFLPRMSREMKLPFPAEEGFPQAARLETLAQSPHRLMQVKGLIVNSLVTDWGWGTRQWVRVGRAKSLLGVVCLCKQLSPWAEKQSCCLYCYKTLLSSFLLGCWWNRRMICDVS